MNASHSIYQSKHKIRFITAASLFDGHDVSINIIRRILQASGTEVIHLGHNRAVHEIIDAAIQEDVQGIAISSYQGGHNEFFKYAVDRLKAEHRTDIQIFGGGGGVITEEEIADLERYGVTRIYSPQEGQQLGLQGIINDMLERTDRDLCATIPETFLPKQFGCLTRIITALQEQRLSPEKIAAIQKQAANHKNTPVLGITGTGGSGKSSLTDELVLRFRQDNPDVRIAILAIDPSKRKTGGALLGDRIRMNAIDHPSIFMRSLATRESHRDVIPHLEDMITACKAAEFDLIIVETPGIGQGDAGIVSFADAALYVMTPEYGAASQLEKIDMLDFANFVAVNKFDRKGGADALRDVAKQMQRNLKAFDKSFEEMPVFGTIAAMYDDQGVTALYHAILQYFKHQKKGDWKSTLPLPKQPFSTQQESLIPPIRQHYLSEIAATVREYHRKAEKQQQLAQQRQSLKITQQLFLQRGTTQPNELETMITDVEQQITPVNLNKLNHWNDFVKKYTAEEMVFKVRHKEIHTPLYQHSLSGLPIPKVAVPKYQSDSERLLWLLKENVPGEFPYTAGVFPFKRMEEDPGRMFAGEGDPARTNKRFKFLSEDMPAVRLSTAFDSVTLYGFDPDKRPDIYGKVGNAGVSIATLDDMKILYGGFDLCDPKTSVSMTINGPAPTILAMFFNTAIDQQVDRFKTQHHREPTAEEYQTIKTDALQQVRGTVQADILKEDQAQNTCIFSTEFALKMMADIQVYFVEHKVRNFYSVSISGYHIAEAGANPISQLAFTLSNGFTYVEAYLARGLDINDFAPNLSFFFSNAMDPEYSVLGRVARRIWAITLRDKYGANERSQKLKYHIQTSGRSLHAQEMAFNDIRTTLEALIAIYDNCNSLHTNAYDEAITTPTQESVRRAQAIQLIINKEWGLAKNENSLQGSFIIEELTDLVEKAVLDEFDRLSERGGVLGAMETGYQRGKIQQESLLYETKKHDGTLPIIGVNTFIDPKPEPLKLLELARSTEQEKQTQLKGLHAFQKRHAKETPDLLKQLQQTVREHGNIFAVLMEAVKYCSLGQISQALFEVGGKYRRNL